MTQQGTVVDQSTVDEANRLAREAHALTGFPHPVGMVQWVHVDQVQANDYNPNHVADHEMRLLAVSIREDGYTQPVVCIHDPDLDKYVVVDGFHRYSTMRSNKAIYDTTGGYLPIVIIDKPIADRIASTVRHNRARGKHSVQGMSNLVFEMLTAGESDAAICNKIGLEAEELARLKYLTGFAKLFANHAYSRPAVTAAQMQLKREYKEQHPDEPLPTEFV